MGSGHGAALRIQFLILALFVLSARSAFAIKPASQSEIDAIEAQLLIANGMDAGIEKAKLKYKAAETNIETNMADLHALKIDVEREEAKQRAARTKAIHMTILAYDLTPSKPDGTSVMPLTKDRTIAWQPVADEIDDRQVQGTTGKLNPAPKPVLKSGGIIAGLTYQDGVTVIPQSSFNFGPGYLASVLLHERTHFEQYTTDGKGNAMTTAERQQEAYQSQVDNSQYFFDSIKDKAMIEDTENYLREEKFKVKQEKSIAGRIRRLLPSNGQPDPAESNIHTNAELADIKRFVAQARAQAESARREREKRESILQTEAQRDHDEKLRAIYSELAQRSCADPGSIAQAELDGLADPYDKQFKKIIPGELAGCSMTVYLGLSRGVDAEKIRRLSVPEPAQVPVNSYQPPSQSAPSAYVPPPAFSTVFPQLQDFSLEACNAPDQVPLGRFLTQPYDFTHRAYDDMLAKDMAAGLGGCSKQLFLQLIEMIRGGDTRRTSRSWLRSAVSALSRTSGISSGRRRSSTDDDGAGSGGGTPGCFVDKYGTQGCPSH
ncbi:MAG: hypothetical protein ABL955_03865 [Elusimicrobiota bacterium]